jgi:hypothetical protein
MGSELGFAGEPGVASTGSPIVRPGTGRMERRTAVQDQIGMHLVPCPATIGTALLLASLDVFAWTSYGPSYRYVVATGSLVVAFAVDGAIRGYSRRIRPGVAIAMTFFGLWMLGVFVYAILTKSWAGDSLVLFAGVIPVLAAPAAYIALPSRPGWSQSLQRYCRGSIMVFVLASFLDALLTPTGEQPQLLGHEKAFLAVLVFAMPNFKGLRLAKAFTFCAVIVAFVKYPSATVGFAAIVAVVCFLLINAKTRPSVYLRGFALVVCFIVIALNASDWISRFYLLVGRGDNTNTRLDLWEQALTTVRESPIVGSAASEPITGLANIRGLIQPVPFHNSFLTLAACCGLVAVILLAIVVLCLSSAVFSVDSSVRKGTGLWLPALLAGAITMSVNPVLDELGTALPFYALILCGAASEISSRKGSHID